MSARGREGERENLLQMRAGARHTKMCESTGEQLHVHNVNQAHNVLHSYYIEGRWRRQERVWWAREGAAGEMARDGERDGETIR